MAETNLTAQAMESSKDARLEEGLSILDNANGRAPDEVLEEARHYLEDQQTSLLNKLLVRAVVDDEAGKMRKEKFWCEGERLAGKETAVLLRRVKSEDRENFLRLQGENQPLTMMKEESFRSLLWSEHLGDKALMCSIECCGEYAGYCGIKDLSGEKWELVIELFEKWQHKGIGFAALSTLLDEVCQRMGMTEFRARISPDNYASQALVEKLGGKPNGISEFVLQGENAIRYEKENMNLLDDKLMAVAAKFHVAPQKLLTHVLEYKIKWK